MTEDAVLLVLGGGRRAAFEAQAAARGVGDRVRFVGSRTDAHRFYQAADVVVLPTRADVWGVTPIEAMACGVPPIVSAAAGSATAVRDGKTGIVLPEPFTPRQLREALDALAASPDLRRAMGAAGAADARAHSWEARGQRVEEDLVRTALRRRAESHTA
jgi:glycosyltransferase involved in cell wall biosynthesis